MKRKKLILFVSALFVIGFALGFTAAECMNDHNHFWSESRWIKRMYRGPMGRLPAHMQWKTYTFSGVDFKYPADWTAKPIQYTNPTGAGDEVGIEITPPTARAGEDKIGIGGRQVICAIFSNNRIKCAEPVMGVPVYTTSENPDVLAIYYQIVASAATSTTRY